MERRELLAVLDDEVTRLPEKYRATIVLCDLEGRTHKEAARQLGCPLGTIKSRLDWARKRLRSRFIDRGLKRLQPWRYSAGLATGCGKGGQCRRDSWL